MSRIQYNSQFKFNQLGTVKYNSSILKSIEHHTSRIGLRPIILNQKYEALAFLENSYNVILDQAENSIDELKFDIPYNDPKTISIQNENIVQMFETLYVIREVSEKGSGDIKTINVFAEALWYDLQFSDPLQKTEWVDSTALEILTDLVIGTGWTVDTVELTTRRNLSLSEETDNVLMGISEVIDLFGGIIKYDTVNKTVSLLKEKTEHSGSAILYERNMGDIEVINNTQDLITKLYVYGKNNLTIEQANDGVKYLENYSYSTTVRVRSIQDERFVNPYHLKEYGKQYLDEICKPSICYKMTAQVLTSRTGLEHEKFGLGSIVRVYNKDIELDLNTKIKKWEYNVVEPWKTKIELETSLKDLSSLLVNNSNTASSSSGESSVNEEQMLELTTNNYLMNSRADDQFSHWNNSGWEVDSASGHSGNCSFKANGVWGSKKELSQTVLPSHRDNYSISFRAKSTNISLGENGRVGINLTIYYDDGTSEEKFISLA